MTKDYKSRPQGRFAARRRQKFDQQPNAGLWKGMLISAIIIAFVVFLVYLRSNGAKHQNLQQISQTQSDTPTDGKNAAIPGEEKKPEAKPGPKVPQFDFYTILPEKEVVVPEYEIQTRSQEERVGKAKGSHYIMQAGSFKTLKEAGQLRKKLAAMGIESNVQKAKVGSVNWYRVKLGPFTQTASVNNIRTRLRQNGIDVIITETGD